MDMVSLRARFSFSIPSNAVKPKPTALIGCGYKKYHQNPSNIDEFSKLFFFFLSADLSDQNVAQIIEY